MDIQAFLTKQFLFESLSPEQIELLAKAASLKKIKKGEQLFSELQPATSFFIVVSGSLKIYKLSSEGSEQILHIQQSGDLVAEAIIFDFDTYPAYCEALEDTVLIRLSKPEFLKLLHHFPEMTFKIMSAYSRRLRLLVAKIEDLSLHDVKTRLAKYLLNNYKIENNKRVVKLSVSKRDLAAILGTIPETLSRTFSYLKREKLIEEERDTIIIVNKTRLKSLF